MTNGLDLAAIQKRLGGHSIFAPSFSATWLYCSGALIPNLDAEDTAGEDAAEGTVGHEVGETWLRRMQARHKSAGRKGKGNLDDYILECRPTDMVGQVRTINERNRTFEIKITDEMLAYVEEYVEYCSALEGEHYIETRVDLSSITPIPKQGGTADHAACTPGLLTITDLKYGKGIQVYAEWNTQALCYALGFFLKFDHLYHFEKIVIRIAQPRREHWDVWSCTRQQLLNWAEWAKDRAYAAWVPDAPRSPGKKQCQWCKIDATCAARLAWLLEETDDVFDDLTIDPDGTISGVEYTVTDMAVAAEGFVSGKLDVAKRPNPGELNTEALEKLLPYRSVIEKWFSAIADELLYRAQNGEELRYHKIVEGRVGDRQWSDPETAAEDLEMLGLDDESMYPKKLLSPAQAEEFLHKEFKISRSKAKMMLSHYVSRAPGKDVLAPSTDRRAVQEDVGAVFEDHTLIDDL